MTRIVLLVLAALLLSAAPASAACNCQCVNGQVQLICQNAYDPPVMCVPTLCPLPMPRLAPLVPPQLPPLGTKQCYPVQVWDPDTRLYVWRTVCR
jgi:hypothetical protein